MDHSLRWGIRIRSVSAMVWKSGGMTSADLQTVKLSLLVAISAAIGSSFLIPMPAEAESCVHLTGDAAKTCYSTMVDAAAGITIPDEGILGSYDATKAQSDFNTSECPIGQSMATYGNKKMGCMTRGQYELWKAQMTAAHRATRTPVYVPPVQTPVYQAPRSMYCAGSATTSGSTTYGSASCY
ncbi:hypothetical protein OAK65_03700 [Synechococcus sp. AH-551-N17]|nr:hypothetical protein [Synechococcus sp. AH-551-N17]